MKAQLAMQCSSTRFILKIFFPSLLCFFLVSSSWAQRVDSSQAEEKEPPTFGKKIPLAKEELLTRGQKTLLLNAGAAAGILIYGITEWDYGKEVFHFEKEGWFGRNTKHGGSDKLGHFWSSYSMSHLISYIYQKWGYKESEANLYGVLSNLGIQTFMEVADGFSSQGFSYEDMMMDIVGSGVAYVWGKYPSLAKKIDFRMEYTPKFDRHDISFSTNYERQKFLIAFKADGFNFVKNPYLQYLEFHVGYYARDYKDYWKGGPDDRHRNIYMGLGFNVSKLLQEFVNTRVLDYIQIPYTSVNYKFRSD